MQGNYIFSIHSVHVRSNCSLAKLRIGSHFREFAERKLTDQVARLQERIEIIGNFNAQMF